LAGLDLQEVDFAGASYLFFRQLGLAGANKPTLDRMSQGLRFESDCQPDFLSPPPSVVQNCEYLD
jgi:hypothetical protein